MTLIDPQGRQLSGSAIPLSTRKGTPIPNDQPPQRHPDSMEVAKAWALSVGDTIQIRSLRSTYNCVGMVFANRRASVEPEHIQTILEEDNYHQLSTSDELQRGDVVIYRDDDDEVSHVGIVIWMSIWSSDESRTVIILSQWGLDGEYFHSIDEVPPGYGYAAEYWTDRS